MPDRFIHETCRTSPTLAMISDGAERLFFRLTTVADDFGRFISEPDVVRSACFPKLLKQFPERRVETLLQELVRSGLIALYVIGEHRYGCFLTWQQHQRTRAEKSKHPEPPADIRCQPQASADNGGHLRPYSYSNANAKSNANTVKPADGFEIFWGKYPKKKAKLAAERAWQKLQPNEQLQGVILASLERAKTSDQWLKDKGQYIPHPATWLNGRLWEDELTQSTNGKSENVRKLEREVLGYEPH